MIKVAVVILNWNGLDFLKRFLPGVIEHSVGEGVEVFVADNGSSDGSVAYTNSVLPHNNIIQFDQNYGFALGYAKALEIIKAEYFVLLNSDVEVVDGWVKPIIDLMDSDTTIAACMPKIRAFEQIDYFEYAGASGGFLDKFGFPFCRGRILTKIEKDEGQYNDVRQVFWATGACMFVRAESYHRVGGLDGDFFAHMEEIDLCWRFNNAGYKVMVCPDVHVFHIGGGTLPNNNPRKLYLNFRNSLFMLYKNLPESHFRRKMFARLLLDGVAALKFLIGLQIPFFFAVLKAHIAFWKSRGTLKTKRAFVQNNIVKNNRFLLSSNFLMLDFFLKNKKVFQELDINVNVSKN